MTLDLVARTLEAPHLSPWISMEGLLVSDGYGERWDIAASARLSSVVEAKLAPTAADVREFVQRAAETRQPTIEFVVGERSGRTLKALERLIRLARSVEREEFELLLAEQGAEARELAAAFGAEAHERLLRIEIDYTSERMLDREILARAHQLAGGAGRDSLIEFVHRKLSSERGRKIDVVSILAELEERGIVVRPPRFPNANDLPERVRLALAVLQDLPQPLPAEALASALGTDGAALAADLADLVAAGVVVDADQALSLGPLPVRYEADHSRALTATLGQLRAYIAADPRRSEAEGQVDNALMLMELLEVAAPEEVALTFPPLDKLLKRRGDKGLVFRTADRAIRAARHARRSEEVARAEAVALICGRSWAYQRAGDLGKARDDGFASLQLGAAIGWDRNTAFCHKCLGRLARIEAETASHERRLQFVNESVELLETAIAEFERLDETAEVGDAYSLLARTHLVAGDSGAARAAFEAATPLLTDTRDKDWADLQIVGGDIAAADGDPTRAAAFYTRALEASVAESQNEMRARAYVGRARLQAAAGDGSGALADLDAAARILLALEEHVAAAEVELEILRLRGEIPDPEAEPEVARLLRHEPPLVQVLAIRTRLRELEEATQDEAILALKEEATMAKWQSLVRDARREATWFRRPW